jgi:hypothetical protein
MIDDIEDLDHMLLLAVWLRGHRRDILEVDPPFHPWSGTLFRLSLSGLAPEDALVAIQDLPDGAGTAR